MSISKILSLIVPLLELGGHSTLILMMVIPFLTRDHWLDEERSKDHSHKKKRASQNRGVCPLSTLTCWPFLAPHKIVERLINLDSYLTQNSLGRVRESQQIQCLESAQVGSITNENLRKNNSGLQMGLHYKHV